MYVLYTLVVPMIIKANYVCYAVLPPLAYAVCSISLSLDPVPNKFIPSLKTVSERPSQNAR